MSLKAGEGGVCRANLFVDELFLNDLISRVIMAEIKTDEMHLECPIKIKRQSFNALLITYAAWLHLDVSFEVQGL